MRSPIYIAQGVKDVQDLHRDVLNDVFDLPIAEQLSRLSDNLFDGYVNGDARVAVEISNWHPKWPGQSWDKIRANSFSADDARLVMARQHGFRSWQQVLALGETCTDPVFEKSVDAVISGNLDELGSLLEQRPALVTATSAYGHRATLLHYLAANGVEMYRQQTPRNAVDVARALVDSGADVNATMEVYGGSHPVLPLLLSSSHPAEAGVADALADLLRRYGAE